MELITTYSFPISRLLHCYTVKHICVGHLFPFKVAQLTQVVNLWKLLDHKKTERCTITCRKLKVWGARIGRRLSRQQIVLLINPLNPELNPICYLLALLGAHHFLHVSRIRVKLLTFRLLMSYIYGATILDVSRSHTTTQHSR